jgi:hypothetical protein
MHTVEAELVPGSAAGQSALHLILPAATFPLLRLKATSPLSFARDRCLISNGQGRPGVCRVAGWRRTPTLPAIDSTVCGPSVIPVPNYPTVRSHSLDPRRPVSCAMTALEPPNVDSPSLRSSTKMKPSKSVPTGDNLPAPPEPSFVLLLCLISGTVPQGERASLIEVIFSSRSATDTVRRLQGCDAQTFVDVVDKARYHSSVRQKCVG